MTCTILIPDLFIPTEFVILDAVNKIQIGGYMFGNENDYKFQMEVDSANHLGVAPEAVTVEAENSLYSSQNGFSDIAVLSSLQGFTDDTQHIATQEPVSEFIAQTDAIQFDSEGHPFVNNSIDASHVASVESLPTDIVARFDQSE